MYFDEKNTFASYTYTKMSTVFELLRSKVKAGGCVSFESSFLCHLITDFNSVNVVIISFISSILTNKKIYKILDNMAAIKD